MPFVPSVVALDYETALLSGEPSLEFYRQDFRITSAALAWRGENSEVKTKYVEGEGALRPILERLKRDGVPVVVHNLPFEYGCTLYRFPGLECVFARDTMRLAQVGDNGGKEAQRYARTTMTYEDQLDQVEEGENSDEDYSTGLSLVACASRWLPAEYRGHKDEAYAHLHSLGVKPGHEGGSLNLLPPALMESYNVSDAVVTLALDQALRDAFEKDGYDYRLDHALYLASAKRISESKGRGVVVDRTKLIAYRQTIQEQMKKIEQDFRTRFADPISILERRMLEAFVMGVKTEKGRENRRRQAAEDPAGCKVRFNVGSNKQLARLFVDELKVRPKFWTEESKASKARRKTNPDLKEFEPSPSFKSAHLAGYGEGGELLVERRKRLLVLTQCDSLLELSGKDGRWHVDLKACGTATGRFAGGRT